MRFPRLSCVDTDDREIEGGKIATVVGESDREDPHDTSFTGHKGSGGGEGSLSGGKLAC